MPPNSPSAHGTSTSSAEPPQVSIVIPTYNGRYLAETIASVQSQTLTRWELIVVDDGSTDNTPERVRDLARADSRIRLLEQRNGGVAAARNVGFAHTTPGAPYVLFLDHDDLLEVDALARAVALLEHRHEVAAVHGEITLIDHGGARQNRAELAAGRSRFRYAGLRSIVCLDDEPTYTAVLISSDCIITPGQVVVRRTSLQRDPFPARFNAYDDWLVWIDVSRTGIIWYEPKPTLRYRLHDENQGKDTRAVFAGRRKTFAELLRNSDLPDDLRKTAAIALFHTEGADSINKLRHVGESLVRLQWRVAGLEAGRAGMDLVRAAQGLLWFARLSVKRNQFGNQHVAGTIS
jgi:glycosyltransferase involved in cell wall biosynthesis